MQTREWIAQITPAGHLPGQTCREFDDLLRSLAGKLVRITVELYEKPRSRKQEKFYHGPFIAAIQKQLLDCGCRISKEDIHEGLKAAFAKNGYRIPLPGGQFLDIPPSTRRFKTTDMNDYLEEIRADYAQRFGWELPIPNEIPIEAYEDETKTTTGKERL